MNARRKNGIILQQSIWKGTQPLKNSVLNIEIIEPHFIANTARRVDCLKLLFELLKLRDTCRRRENIAYGVSVSSGDKAEFKTMGRVLHSLFHAQSKSARLVVAIIAAIGNDDVV